MQEVVSFVQDYLSRPLAIIAMVLVGYLVIRQYGSDLIERVRRTGLADGPTAHPSLDRLKGFAAATGSADSVNGRGSSLTPTAHGIMRWDLKQSAGGAVIGALAATSLFFVIADDEPAYFLVPRTGAFVEFSSMERCRDFAAKFNADKTKAGFERLCYLK